jgi:TolB protein
MKSLSLRALPLALTFLSLDLLHAQINVGVSTLPRVGISISGGAGSVASQVLGNDLKRSGELIPASAGEGEYQATGTADAGGVTGSLVDKHSGQTLFSQSFTGSTRTASHEFADAITKAITGLPGFASSKIAFVSGGGIAKELFYGDIDGYNTRAITHDNVDAASPALSRDGTKLAYTSYKSGYPDVYVIDLASGTRNRIAYFPGSRAHAARRPRPRGRPMATSWSSARMTAARPSSTSAPRRAATIGTT